MSEWHQSSHYWQRKLERLVYDSVRRRSDVIDKRNMLWSSAYYKNTNADLLWNHTQLVPFREFHNCDFDTGPNNAHLHRILLVRKQWIQLWQILLKRGCFEDKTHELVLPRALKSKHLQNKGKRYHVYAHNQHFLQPPFEPVNSKIQKASTMSVLGSAIMWTIM